MKCISRKERRGNTRKEEKEWDARIGLVVLTRLKLEGEKSKPAKATFLASLEAEKCLVENEIATMPGDAVIGEIYTLVHIFECCSQFLMTIDDLLQDFLSQGAKFFPATNSLKFHSNTDANKNYLWIEPPWRIVKGNKVIASSFTCPWHEDFKTKEEYSKAFADWCQTMRYLNDLEIKRHLRGQTINDLIIEWTDGSTLEVLQKRQEDDAWYITDNNEKKYYLAFPDKIQIKEMT
jgi:hypothetical protein